MSTSRAAWTPYGHPSCCGQGGAGPWNGHVTQDGGASETPALVAVGWEAWDRVGRAMDTGLPRKQEEPWAPRVFPV